MKMNFVSTLVSIAVVAVCFTAVEAGTQLTFPYTGNATTTSPVFAIDQNGTGHAGFFKTFKVANNYATLVGMHKGGGVGIYGQTYSGRAGVYGDSLRINGIGLYGRADSGSNACGVYGYSLAGRGVVGETSSTIVGASAVVGTVIPTTVGAFSAGVRGINNGSGGSGIGVYGSHAASGWGVYGTAPSGIGVYGSSSSGIGVYGGSSSGYAGVFTGKVRVTGDLEKDYRPGSSVRAVPIAYGTVSANGDLMFGTPNVSVVWVETTSRYDITIENEYYYYSEYTTIVTPAGAASGPAIPVTDSAVGKLTIHIFDVNGTKLKRLFQFVVYKGTEITT